MGQELESPLDIATDVTNADKPSQGVARNRGDLPGELEGDQKLFIAYQPREFARPTDGVHQGRKVWSDILVEGRMVFVGVGVIILTAVRSIATGKIIRALGMNEVDPMKVRVWDTRLEGVIGTD